MKSFGSRYITPFQGCEYGVLLDIGLHPMLIYITLSGPFFEKTILKVGIALGNKDFNIS
jgi:hypothetical protein